MCFCLAACAVQAAEPVVSVRTVAPDGIMAPGSVSVLTIELDISPEYHINSDRPLQNYLIPTVLQIEPQPGVVFGTPSFPEAPEKKLPFSDSPMAVYEGKVRITVPVTRASGFDSRELKVAGKVRYQACNNSYCLPPVTQAFSAMLPVAASGEPGGASAVSLTKTGRPVKEGGLTKKPAAEPIKTGSLDFANRSLLVTFIFVFLGGLALNLTPCVYPMIPITITYFGGQAEGKKGSLVAHSVLYVIGMAVTYSVLGVAAAMTGGFFGAALQYRSVLIGISLIMVLLALSMFDLYELRMPQFLNRLAGVSQKGFAGTFLMGLTVGIVAAPCIGPFVLALLTYVGNKGNPILGFALFFVLALGLGVPFLVLGIFSGSIRRLPRSGAWMIWVRKIFGFVLLAMAVYFLKPLFPGHLAYPLALAMIMVLGGIYLAWIDAVPGSGKMFAFVRNLVGVLFFAAALYSAATALEANVGSNPAGSAVQSTAGSIRWMPYSDSMLDQALKESKPVFIDFYADWCVPCKELDARTFATPEVTLRSREFVMLKVDLTSADNPQSESLKNKYQARGVPTLVFLTPDGREIPEIRGTGFEPKEVFLRKMDRALQLSSGVQKGPM